MRVVSNVLPIFLIIILKLSMFEFSFAFPEFFLLRRFVKLVLRANIRQFILLFLLVLVLEVLQDRINIVIATTLHPHT